MRPIATVLSENGDAIIAGWLALLRDSAGPLYADEPTTELFNTAWEGFNGLVELLRSGDDQQLYRYVHNIVRKRHLQGFQLAEVQRAFISLREVIWPFIMANYLDRDSLAKAVTALDLAMSHAVLEFSLSYETQVTRRFQQLAVTDPLTRLYNRRYLDLMLENEVARLGRDGRALSVLFIDLDHFKRFNDTHGHLLGDRALVTVAGLLRNHVREADVVTRYGGEEFVIVLPETDRPHAVQVAERLRRVVAATAFAGSNGPARLTISAGVATATARTSVKHLLQSADMAAYRAKRTGRNRVCVAGETTTKSA